MRPGDVVGIGIHTGNAHRGYRVGRLALSRGAYVIFGGIHATLYPDEARTLGGAHTVVRGDGDVIWSTVLADCEAGHPQPVYEAVDGIPLTRYWLIPPALRPKVYAPHPLMSASDIRRHTQETWDRFYRLSQIWQRAACVRSLRSRLAFVLVSKLYRQMYANTGIATDSARGARSARWARWLARPCRRLFIGRPMPQLAVPARAPVPDLSS